MSEQAEEDKSRIVEPAIAADAAEGVGLSWVSVEERLPDEEQGDLLIYNTKWVDSMAAEDVDENCRGWYWLPLSAIPLPGQSSEPSAALRARVEALEAGLREIEDWAPNWAQGVDENVDAIRERARALLEQKP